MKIDKLLPVSNAEAGQCKVVVAMPENGDQPNGPQVLRKLEGAAVGVKVYRALLTQVAAGAPLAFVEENTLGGTLVWTRSQAGAYVGTLVGAFTALKSMVFINHFSSFTATLFRVASIGIGSVDTVVINTREVDLVADTITLTDDLLAGTPVEILVYP